MPFPVIAPMAASGSSREWNGMDSTSVWLSSPAKTYPPLDRDLEVDVLIVGAGITGITAGYLLKQEGLKVAVVDRGTVGGGETGHTTAHLTQVTDKRFSELVDLFGRDHAQAVWDAGQFAVDQIFAIADTCGIACHLHRAPGYQFVASGTDAGAEAEALHREAHLIEELGFDCTFQDSVPLMHRPGICFPNQAQFHPIEYLRALASHVDGGGSFIFENSAATHFESSPHSATINGHKVRFERSIFATHVPIQGTSPTLAAMLRQTKLASYSTYAMGGVLPKGTYPHALLWDTADPYLYIRIFPEESHDVVIIGGEDHKTGQGDPEAAYKRLRQKAESIPPKAVWKWRWSGQVVETPDGLPYIGEAQPHEFLATGFAGNGMTFGTLAAMMARDWALELRNPWIDLFSVDRKKLATAWDYLAENKDYPFYLAKGSLDSAERAEPESVASESGKVLRWHGKKVAAYRDGDGHLHLHSAICPHLGCVVKWNAAEKTWDCPCHGSRFAATGEVIAGPAESPLAAAAEPAATHA